MSNLAAFRADPEPEDADAMAQWQALEDEVNRLFGNGRPVLDVVALDVNEVRTAAVGSEISIEEAYEIMEYFEAKLSRTANTQCHRLDMSHRALSKAALEVLDPVLVKISRTVNILVLGIVSGEPDEQELSLQHLARLFSQAKQLHSVECRKINFGAIPSGVKCLVPLLEKTSVKKWVFYQANLTESCALWLRYSLHRSIQTLHITESNDIGSQGAAYIGQLVSQCSDLSSFSYCRNGQDVEISAAIGEGLYNVLDLCKAAGTTTRLASLDLSDIVIPHPTDGTGYKGAQLNVLHILCSTLRGLPSLSSFTMRNAILGGSPVERMHSLSGIFRALFLDSHARLYRLDLSHLQLGLVGAKLLYDFLWSWPATYRESLRSLVLDGNDLSDRGTEVVAMATAPCHLYQLHLNNNDIGDLGASAFLERRFLKLAELSLSGNSGISTRMAMRLKKKLGTKSPPCYLLGFCFSSSLTAREAAINQKSGIVAPSQKSVAKRRYSK